MRVALVKPDWGVRGGAEAVVDRLERLLEADGHQVTRRSVPVPALPRTPYDIAVPAAVWDQAPEYFRYQAAADAVSRLDLSSFDAVVSTQAPSFVVDHPRHLSLFFHHLRVFYDLEDLYVAAGLAGDPEVHATARDRIRAQDQEALERVTWFSPNSEVTAGRLARFNGLSNVTVHHAGRAVEVSGPSAAAEPGTGPAVCVGRCELSKRTELAVAAAHLAGRPLAVIGDGGRLAFATDLDRRLVDGAAAPEDLTAEDLWRNAGTVPTGPVRRRRPTGSPPAGTEGSPVRFLGRLEPRELSDRYRSASCVVAPAFGEDYGLTAVEAMAHGRPVIVCRDGGGLDDIVEHDVDGLVVEPSVHAVAAAMDRLASDPDLASRLGAAGLIKAATFTWDRTEAELRAAFAARHRMRIAIIAPEAASGAIGGAERAWAGLRKAIERHTQHQASLVTLAVEEHDLVGLVEGYRRFADLDVSGFDLVITSKYPAWLVDHPNHVLHLFHPLRGLYDTYHLTGLPLEYGGRPRSRSVAELLDAIRRPPTRAGLPELFDRFDDAVAAVGHDHADLALPGPLARELVHHLDAVALSPPAVRRHLALSRTLAARAGYFPIGVVPQVVHLPSDLPPAAPAEGARQGFFTASRLDTPKRLDLLVDAMAHVRADVELAIAGTGPEADRLRSRATGDARIRFLGPIEDDELAARYAGALAVPFVPADEDYGLITVEAMAAGTPVVTTTDAGGPTELVVNGVDGLVASPDPASLGRALDHLAADPAWAAHLGRSARRRAEEITWPAAVAAILGEAAPTGATDRPGPAGRTRGGRRLRFVVPSTYAIDPPRGGGQLRYRHLYGALARRADVHVVSLVNPPRPTTTTVLAPGLTETVVGVSDRQLADDVELTSATGIPTTDIVAGRSIAATPAYLDALRTALDGADGVILSHPFLLPALDAVGSTLPFVYDAHNAEADLKADVLGRSAAGRDLADWVRDVEGRAVHEAEHVVTCSVEDADTLQRWFGRDPAGFVVIPNGTDTRRWVPTPDERRARRDAWLAAWNAAPPTNAAQPPGGAAPSDRPGWRSQARRGAAERDQQTQPPGGAAPSDRPGWRSQARRGAAERDQQTQPPGGAAPSDRPGWRSRRRRGLPSRRPTNLAVFFASWHPPNLDAAEVLIDVADSVPEVVFVLAGSHSDHFRSRSVPPNVVLAGVVSEAAKATLLATADVALNPMRLGSGTNLKLVEYFAAGVPAVSTPFGARGLDVDSRHLVLAETDQLPAAIRSVTSDPAAAAERAAAGRALVVGGYDWQALGDRLAEVLGITT